MTELNLASGASYFRSPEVATTAAIAAINNGLTYYGPAEGTAELRQAIVERYLQDGITIKPEQVLITPGTKQALFNLFSVLLRDGDEVVIPIPAWFGFNELLKYSKGKLITVQTTLENNYSLDLETLREKLTTESRILLLTNPANPTGRIYSKHELETIVALLHDFPDLYLISDEIYDLDTYGEPFTSALGCKRPQQRIIVVNGFSKNFAMSGWRIGYMVAPEEIIRQSTDFQSSTFSGVSMFIQEAALATIKHKTASLEPILNVLQEHRLVMQRGLEAITHVSFFVPDGAYYFFPYLGHYIGTITRDGESINSTEDLCNYLQNDHKLIVVNGDNFGGVGHVRMSFAVERSVLDAAMSRLKKGITAVKTSTGIHRQTINGLSVKLTVKSANFAGLSGLAMQITTYKEHFSKNFSLAYPVVLSQLGHILVSVFDSLMVGQIGTVQLAAASLAGSIFMIVMVFGMGVSFSITPLIAAAEGRKNYTRISLLLLNGLVSNFILGILLFIAGYFLSPYITHLNQPEEVVALAIPFINVLFLSMVPLMLFQAFKQFAEGLSFTKQSMYITIVANLLNIALNYVLIWGKLGFPEMGMIGAAWATLISRVIMALMMAGWVMYAKRFEIFRHFLKLRHLSFIHMYRIFKLGLPISGQMIFEMGAFSFSAIMIGWLGTKQLAAHQIAINVASVTYMMASGIAAAATIRVGNQKGLGNYRSMQMAGNSSFAMGVLFMLSSGLLMIAGNNQIPMLYIDDPEVIQIASTLLIIAALFQISDGVQVVGLGALRGLEDVRVPGVISLIAYWVIGLPVGYMLGFKLGFGVNGVWLGLLAGLSVAALLLFLRFKKLSNQLVTT